MGQCGENRVRSKVLNVGMNAAICTGLDRPGKRTLHGRNQQMLQIERFRCFNSQSLRVGANVSGWWLTGLSPLTDLTGPTPPHLFFQVSVRVHLLAVGH